MMRAASAALFCAWLTCAAHVAAQEPARGGPARPRAAAGAHGKRAQAKSARARAAAQKRSGAAAPAPKDADATPSKPAAASADKASPASANTSAGRAETAAPSVSPPSAANDDGSPEPAGDVRTEGDTQVKMMEFSGLDIEGQLKTPQMLYFLNRLRAEFGHPRLPHRSFMPELQRSTREKAF
jgi:hypothetical protein